MDALLSNSPLSSGYHRRLSQALGSEPVIINFIELRQLPLRQLAQRLWSMRFERIVVPNEDPGSTALNPILYLVAYFTRSKRVISASPDVALKKVSRAETLWLIVQTAIATIGGMITLRRIKGELARLHRNERVNITRPADTSGLFLNANLWFGIKAGGSVGHISGVINGFSDLGYSMSFASAGGRMMVHPSVPMVHLAPPRFFGVPWETNYYRFHYAVTKQLRAIARRFPIEFIYQRMSLANFSGVTLSRELKIPLILEYNGSEVWVARNWGRPLRYDAMGESAENVAISHAHLVVAISEVLGDELVERGVPAERVVVYPNCIDETIFDPERFDRRQRSDLRAFYGIPEDALVVTFLGTFGQWHGTELLAQAIVKLKQESPALYETAHFLFVGDGLRMPDVKATLGELAIGGNVTLAGLVPQDDAPLHLAISDILASPHAPNVDGSRFFGSPTKLFEYLAMGKAILASELDQIGEILADSDHIGRMAGDGALPAPGSAALLVTPGNVDELTAGLRHLLSNPDWRAQIGQNARKLALSRYTWRHHVGAIMDRARKLGLVKMPIGELQRVPSDHAIDA